MSYTTTATNSFSGNNTVIVTTIANMISGLPIVFTGNVFGNVTANATFYIGNITGSNQITLSSLPGGAVYALANGSGNMTVTFSTGGQQIIDVVPPGDPLDVAFEKTNVNFDQIFASGPVGSNIQIANNTIRTTNTNGNLILSPNGIGNVVSNVNIVPNTANLRNLGSPTQRWATIYTQYIDYTAGNISFSNFSVSGNINAGGYISAAGNVTGNYILGNGSLLTGISVSTNKIFNGNSYANIATANGNVVISANGVIWSFKTNGVTAFPAFTFPNIDGANGQVLVTNGNGVTAWGNGGQFSVITNQTITGNGVAGNFALAQSATSDSVFVTINGISQTPAVDYTVLGNVITFTTIPIVGDTAQIRFLAGNVLNVNYSNANVAAFLPTYTGNVSANYFIGNGSQLTGIAGGTGNTGNITFSNTTITSNVANANVTVQGNGTGNVNLGSSVSVAGNITANYLYGNGYYLTGLLTTITNQTLAGNNVATNFTLNQTATANAILVTVNGISQTPDVDYTVSGNVITFTTAPYTGDTMQVRFLANNFSSGGGGGNGDTGNITFNNTTISSNVANANIFLQASGTGNVVITNTSNSKLTIESTASNITNGVTVRSQGTAQIPDWYSGGVFEGTHILGNGSPAQNLNRFAAFVGSGSEDGTTILSPSPVRIFLQAAGNWSTGNTPTQISFLTTPFGSNTASSQIRMTPAGDLNLSSGNISVIGNIRGTNISTVGISASGNVVAGNFSTFGNVSAAGNVYANNFVGNIAAAPGNTSIQINVDGVLGSAADFSYDYGANVLYSPSAAFTGNLNNGTAGLFVGLPAYTFLGSNVVTQITSNVASYTQVNQQNINSGNAASGDYVITADNGSDTTFYIDIGMASSNHADPDFFGDTTTVNDAYMYVVGTDQAGPASSGVGNLLIGSTNGNIKLFVGNTAQANVIQTISSTGISIVGVITLTNSAVIKDTAGYAVAFGRYAGNITQGSHAVAIGDTVGYTGQGAGAVAIGWQTGETTQGASAVAVGVQAGSNTQGNSAVAIGLSAGANAQGANAVAIGSYAGNSSQGSQAVAVGNSAGRTGQGTFAVAIGYQAGNNLQANNSIILNATGAVLDQTTANTFTVAPVRNDVANIGQVLFYNATSKEITYGNVISVAGNITGGNISATNHTGTTVSVTGNITGGNLAISGNSATITSANYSIGYLNIPQVSFAANATIALTDAGKHYYSTSASNLLLTIANNTSVSWTVGTAITIVNRGTANITIAQGTGVSLYLAGNSTSGNRTMTTYGMSTLMNVAANVWMINGTGVV